LLVVSVTPRGTYHVGSTVANTSDPFLEQNKQQKSSKKSHLALSDYFRVNNWSLSGTILLERRLYG